MQPLGIGFTTAAYMQLVDIEYIAKSYIQLSMGLAYLAVYYTLFISHLLMAIVIKILAIAKSFQI